MDCIFCKIANKEIASRILYEDDLVMVIMDANPVSNGHALVIPKKHYTDFLEMDDDLLKHMFKIAKEIGPKNMDILKAKSLTLLINYGDDQTVKHLHLHLIPDYLKSVKNPNIKEIEDVYNLLHN